MRNIIVPALAAFSLAIIATPAAAETASTTVQFADLDLSSPAGQAALEGRIKAATKRICGGIEVRDVRDGADHQRCVQQVNASARVEIARLTGSGRQLALKDDSKARR